MFSPVVKHLSSKSCLMAHYVLRGSFRGVPMDRVMPADAGRDRRLFDGKVCRNHLRGDGERRPGARELPAAPPKTHSCWGVSVLLTPPNTVWNCPLLTAFPARCCQKKALYWSECVNVWKAGLVASASFAFPSGSETQAELCPLPFCPCQCSCWPGCVFLFNF